jgi:hypothetical protein
MANICSNEFYAGSSNPENIKYIIKFIQKEFDGEIEFDEESVDADFSSKWVYPSEQMDKLYEGLPDKEHIYMRCLSVEYGCEYVEFHICDGEGGWYLQE